MEEKVFKSGVVVKFKEKLTFGDMYKIEQIESDFALSTEKGFHRVTYANVKEKNLRSLCILISSIKIGEKEINNPNLEDLFELTSDDFLEFQELLNNQKKTKKELILKNT